MRSMSEFQTLEKVTIHSHASERLITVIVLSLHAQMRAFASFRKYSKGKVLRFVFQFVCLKFEMLCRHILCNYFFPMEIFTHISVVLRPIQLQYVFQARLRHSASSEHPRHLVWIQILKIITKFRYVKYINVLKKFTCTCNRSLIKSMTNCFATLGIVRLV